MTKSFSVRDWSAIAVGVACALIPVVIFKSGDMTPFWVIVLLGPPLAFLVSPRRPILAWQVPMITTAVFAALTSREVWEPRYLKSQLGVGLLAWVGTSLLSFPWVIVFAHRVERTREQPSSKPGAPSSYIGLGLLVFLAIALVIVGLALSVRTYDSTDPRESATSFEAFLIATLGIGIAVAACRIAANMGASKGVEDVLGMFLSFAGIPAVIGLVVALWEDPKSLMRLPSQGVFWFAITELEIVAVVVWLLLKAKRERKARAMNGKAA